MRRRRPAASAAPRRWLPWALTGAAVALGYAAGREGLHLRAAGPVSVPPRASSADTATHLEIRDLIDARGFTTAFQPVFALDDGQLLMVEALTRFDAAGRTTPVDCPARWFRVAGEVGLGVELELAAIDRAVGAAEALPAHVPLSVNVSPATLADPRLEGLLDVHVDRRVVLEVTEHAVVTDYSQLVRVVARLRARGCLLAVDDAGAGFASLRHVVRLDPDLIKLDASLTQGIEQDRMRRALAQSLILFAHRTGSRLIVEGIERPADLAAWHELGADGAQGYLLGRPGPIADWHDGPTLITSTTRSVPSRPDPWRQSL